MNKLPRIYFPTTRWRYITVAKYYTGVLRTQHNILLTSVLTRCIFGVKLFVSVFDRYKDNENKQKYHGK